MVLKIGEDWSTDGDGWSTGWVEWTEIEDLSTGCEGRTDLQYMM